MLITKLFMVFTALFLLSGCCDLLGICTSASIHTSISRQQKYALQNTPPGIQLAQQSSQSCEP
jgi:hypothetical protein